MKSCLKTRSTQGEDRQWKEEDGFGSPSNQAVYGQTYVAMHDAFLPDPECEDEVEEGFFSQFSEMALSQSKRARISSCAPTMQDIRLSSTRKIKWGTMQEIHGQG